MIDISIYNEITQKIIGAAMEVHNHLGYGFLEQVYQKAMEEELKLRNIPFLSQNPVKVFYKEKEIAVYVPDLIIENKIIVEIKALEIVNYEHIQTQIINYLVATKKDVGLYLNFGKEKLDFKRYILPKKFQSVNIC
jgi:GxxExxY protein